MKNLDMQCFGGKTPLKGPLWNKVHVRMWYLK